MVNYLGLLQREGAILSTYEDKENDGGYGKILLHGDMSWDGMLAQKLFCLSRY